MSKSLTVIICADVQLTWLSEVPLELLGEAGHEIEVQVGKLLRELFAGAPIEMQPTLIDERNLFDILHE